MRKNEDPRLSFSTPEFKEAQRIFTDGFKVGFLIFVGAVWLSNAALDDFHFKTLFHCIPNEDEAQVANLYACSVQVFKITYQRAHSLSSSN